MKQATVKTLGAAAVGVAFAAAGAGTASAASLTDSVEETAGKVIHTLPVEEAAAELPGDSDEVVNAGTEILTGNPPLASETLSHTSSTASDTTSNINGDLGEVAEGVLGGGGTGDLLGGLPAGSLGLSGA